MLEHGADGIAFGFLKEDQTLDTERTKEVIYLIHEQGREAVFHRAFDCVADQKKTIEQLIGLGADRILTSGGAPDVWSGRERLKQLQKEYGSEIEILAGSGVNENNVRELMTYTGVHQVHSSCRVWKKTSQLRMNTLISPMQEYRKRINMKWWMQQKYTDWQNCVDKYFVKTYNKIMF